MSVLTLEAFDAEHGDCLLLHWGERPVPHFLLIDGGPGTDTFIHRLRPRLNDLKRRFGAGGPLPLPLVIASHIDDDHIGGLLALLQDLEPSPRDIVKIGCLWHNSFDALAGDRVSDAHLKRVLARLPEIERYPDAHTRDLAEQNWEMDKRAFLVTASVSQGRDLRNEAQRLGIELNCTFPNGVVVAPVRGAGQRSIHRLELTVVWPDQERLEKLRREWRAHAVTAAVDDTSITNLASIVVLTEFAGQRVLLTGDARGDHIIDGMEQAGIMSNGGSIDIDILKVQHHGSDHSSDRDFFQRVRARHYVISANGRNGNPAQSTLQEIVDARGSRGYTVHLTNCGQPGAQLRQIIDQFKARYPGIFRCRAAMASSIRIELGDSVD
jgi:beta-lactamase superfamily II metal-dependent hydrolase